MTLKIVGVAADGGMMKRGKKHEQQEMGFSSSDTDGAREGEVRLASLPDENAEHIRPTRVQQKVTSQ